MGYLRSKEGKWDIALKELKEANNQSPNNAEILRCLGWALFHSNQRAQGVVTLERALNLDQGNPLTLCDLGSAYLEVRNFAKARALFQRAIEIDPENKRARECAQMTDRLMVTFDKVRKG